MVRLQKAAATLAPGQPAGDQPVDKEWMLTGLETALAMQLATALMTTQFPLQRQNRPLTGIQTLLAL